jgi:hypothetical protein
MTVTFSTASALTHACWRGRGNPPIRVCPRQARTAEAVRSLPRPPASRTACRQVRAAELGLTQQSPGVREMSQNVLQITPTGIPLGLSSTCNLWGSDSPQLATSVIDGMPELPLLLRCREGPSCVRALCAMLFAGLCLAPFGDLIALTRETTDGNRYHNHSLHEIGRTRHTPQ